MANLIYTLSNEPPIAVDDLVYTNEETILYGNVFANNGNSTDSDPNRNLITVTQVNGSTVNVGKQIQLASGALLTLNANGTFTYDPNGHFNDFSPLSTFNNSFIYAISDSNGATDTATDSVHIKGVNDQVYIEDQTFTVLENSDNSTIIGQLIVHHIDQNDWIYYQIIDGNSNQTFYVHATYGYLTVYYNNSLNYEQQNSYTFTVQINDIYGFHDTAQITINLININETPAFVSNQVFSINENNSNNAIVGTTLATDPDYEQILTYSIIEGNEAGFFTINSATGEIRVANGKKLNYELMNQYNLMIKVIDNATSKLWDVDVIPINVNDLNEAPQAQNITLNINEASSHITKQFIASDEDKNDTLTFALMSQPKQGSVVNNNNGTFTFSLGTAFQDLSVGETRSTNFKYKAIDSLSLSSQPATVTVQVTGINDAPVVNNLTVSVTANQPTTGISFAGDDIDNDDSAESLIYSFTSVPNLGSVSVGNNGTFNFNPGNNFKNLSQGQIQNLSLGYKATDSHGLNSNTGTITLAVVGENDAPTVQNINLTATEDTLKIVGNYLGNDIDNDDNPTSLNYLITSQLSQGSVKNNSNATFTYSWTNEFAELNLGETHSISFTYVAIDKHGSISNTGVINIIIQGLNNSFEGTVNDDLIVSTNVPDTISGSSGHDTLYGYRGNGTSGVGSQAIAPTSDTSSFSDNDLIDGGQGNDYLIGGRGTDELIGGVGNDTLYGGISNDILKGGSGDDTYLWVNGDGRDIYQDTEGFDVLNVAASQFTLSSSFQNTGIEKMSGQNGTKIVGNSFKDTWNFQNVTLIEIDKIDAGAGDDWVQGSQGNDYLFGNYGKDQLIGGTGADTLEGDWGNDTLTGGSAADRFVLNPPNEGIDLISDFSVTQDLIVVSASDFGSGLTLGTLQENQFTVGSAATKESDRFIYNSATGDLLFDDDGTGINPQVQLAKLSGNPALNFQQILVN